MSFTLSAGLITQDGGTTNNSLAGLQNLSDVTRTFEGTIAVYTIVAGTRMDINGTLTINPELERLNFNVNECIRVANGGRLNLGTQDTTNSFNRNTIGPVINSNRAQPIWFGAANETAAGNSLRVLTGGEFRWRSGTILLPGGIFFQTGSSAWIEDGILQTRDFTIGESDPITGTTIAGNTRTGINEGITSNSNVLIANRGYLSFFYGSDIRIDNLKVLGGGEIVFNSTPTGNNSIALADDSLTLVNGIDGYTAEQTVAAIFSRSTFSTGIVDFQYSNIEVDGTGNSKDLAIQTISPDGPDSGQRYTNIKVNNATGGTAVRCIAAQKDEGLGDQRNKGTVRFFRDINFDLSDGLTNTKITGGRYFVRDTDNGNRKDQNTVFVPSPQGFDLTNDIIYTDSLTNGSLTSGQVEVLLGAVQVQANSTFGGGPATGSSIISNATSGNVPTIGTDGQQTNPSNLAIWRMDVRGTDSAGNATTSLGEDYFLFNYWHPAYNYFSERPSLSDGTTGTHMVSGLLTQDAVYTGSQSTTTTSVATVQELYNALKDRKVVSTITVEEPTARTLWAREINGFFDVGPKALKVVSGTATGGFTPTLSTFDISIGTNSSLTGGGSFSGLESSVSISCTNIDLPTVNVKATLINDIPNPIPANSSLEGTFNNFPFSPNALVTAVEDSVILNGTYTETNLLFDSGRDIVFSTSSNVEDLVLILNSTGDVSIYGKQESDFTTAPVNNGSGSIVYPIPVEATTVLIRSEEPTSFYCLYDQTNNLVVEEGTHTTGTDTILSPIENVNTGINTYRIYLLGKFASSVFYSVNSTSFTNDIAGGQKTVSVATIIIPSILTEAAAGTTFGMETLVFSLPSTTTGLLTMANATTQLSAARTQRLFLLAREGVGTVSLYLRMLATREILVDLILPVVQAGTLIDSDVLTVTATSQQIVTALGRTDDTKGIATFTAGGLTFASVIIIPNPAGLSGSEAQIACANALSAFGPATPSNVATELETYDGAKQVEIQPAALAALTEYSAAQKSDIVAGSGATPTQVQEQLVIYDGAKQAEIQPATVAGLTEYTAAQKADIVAGSGATPAEVNTILNDRRVTRENMNRLGILAPINDNDV